MYHGNDESNSNSQPGEEEVILADEDVVMDINGNDTPESEIPDVQDETRAIQMMRKKIDNRLISFCIMISPCPDKPEIVIVFMKHC